ncbi:MAG: cupin domain-containing protein [Candidatus Caldatribacteriaceae bacterium]
MSDTHFQKEPPVGSRLYHFKSTDEKRIEQIVNADEVQINHLVLPQGEKVPEHYSNSNVYLIVVKGTMTITLEGEPRKHLRGDILFVPYHTRMLIENEERETLEFFVVKAPHPERYRQSLA